MPWTTPTDFVEGQIVHESDLDNLSNNLSVGVVRPIAEVTLSGAAATIDFSAIPATFRSLMLTVLARSDAGAGNVEMYARINNAVTAGTYHSQAVFGAGGSPAAFEYAGNVAGVWLGLIPAASAGTTIMFGASEMIAFDYTNASSMKVFRTVNMHRYGGAGNMRLYQIGSTWDSGAVINQITLWLSSGNFVTNSRATLYGVPA